MAFTFQLLHLKLTSVVLWPTSLADNFIFDDFITLSQFLPLYVFLDGELHALCDLLLLLGGVATRIVARGHWCLLRWRYSRLKPWLIFHRKTALHADLQARRADLWSEGTLLYVFFEVLRFLVLVMPVRQLVAPKLVDMFHSLGHLRASQGFGTLDYAIFT